MPYFSHTQVTGKLGFLLWLQKVQGISIYTYIHSTNTTGEVSSPSLNQLLSPCVKKMRVEAVEIPHELNSSFKHFWM